MEEDFCCQETDIFDIAGEGVLNINQDHCWRLEGYHQGEGGDSFTKGFFSNGRMHVCYLDVPSCGALGE